MTKRILLSLLTCLALAGHAQTRWCVVDAARPDTPIAEMTDVAFLLTSDWHDLITVVGKDGSISSPVEALAFRRLDPAGISRTVQDGQPQLLPSPVGGQLTLTGCKAGSTITIYDAAGSTLKTLTAAEGSTDIDLCTLPAGVYILRTGSVAIKFIKR